MYWLRSVFLYIAILFFGGSMTAQQQTSDEEKAFILRIYQAQHQNDAEAFLQASLYGLSGEERRLGQIL